MQYHIDFIKNLLEKTEVSGKTILEIGCGEGGVTKALAQEKPKFIIGIEPMLDGYYYSEGTRTAKEEEGENWRICRGNALNLRFPDNSFDIVISVATFEHIEHLDQCLAEIKRVLKPGGIFYTEYGPIWSGVIGHHCCNWIKSEVLKIPAWGHLYMTKEEMHAYLTANYSKEEADSICRLVYEDKWINRIDFKDMKRIFEASGMKILELKENTLVNRLGWLEGACESELSEEIVEKLADRYTPDELKVCSINLFMQKEK